MKTGLMLIAALVLTLAGGCGKGKTDPRLVLAEKCCEEGDFQAAERQFLRYLAAHPESGKVHLRLASLYDESLLDPLSAVCHYREYLRLEPNAPDAETVKAWLLNALIKCVPQAEPGPPPEALRLLEEENRALKERLQEQETLLAKLRTPPVPEVRKEPEAKAFQTAKAPAPAEAEFTEYTVKEGDHLGKIARKFYGNARQIEPIMTANHLTEKSMLKIGQKLKIPKVGR